MKILVGFFLLVLLFPRCNNASRNKYRAEDSLAYYPPTPQKMQLEEFRNYYRLLSSFFDTTLLNKGFNGGILIAKNGEVIYEKYAGKIDIRKKDSLSNTTPLHIASTSKTFTAIAILRLVQEKNISGRYFAKIFSGLTLCRYYCTNAVIAPQRTAQLSVLYE
ncbi:MAG: serine hydrolase [Chitinophagaceae bacterium]|nr:serine hydrolase [Chitinophagaceae bacterium]